MACYLATRVPGLYSFAIVLCLWVPQSPSHIGSSLRGRFQPSRWCIYSRGRLARGPHNLFMYQSSCNLTVDCMVATLLPAVAAAVCSGYVWLNDRRIVLHWNVLRCSEQQSTLPSLDCFAHAPSIVVRHSQGPP